MIIVCSSYNHHMFTLQSLYVCLTIILCSSYNHCMFVLQSSYVHLTIIKYLSYNHLKLILQSSYVHLTIILWLSYVHLTIILCSSYDYLIIMLCSSSSPCNDVTVTSSYYQLSTTVKIIATSPRRANIYFLLAQLIKRMIKGVFLRGTLPFQTFIWWRYCTHILQIGDYFKLGFGSFFFCQSVKNVFLQILRWKNKLSV